MEKLTAISKAVWLEKISKELKNASFSDLEREVAHDVWVSPFVHAEDFSKNRSGPLFFSKATKNDWLIGEKIEVHEPSETNKMALAALAGGAESLDFSFDFLPVNAADFSKIFEGVFLEMISTTFSGLAVKSSPSVFFGLFLQLAQSKNLDEKQLRGALDFDPTVDLSELPDWRFWADLVSFSSEKMPFFKAMTLETEETDAAASLAELLKKANLVVKKMTEKGLAPNQVLASMQIRVALGTDFLTEVSRLRALQILWLNFQKAWAIEPSEQVPIIAVFSKTSYVDDPNQNMIRATEMSLAAALGGAEHILVSPFSNEKIGAADDIFYKRIARNVQHILKSESFVGRVEDPVSGAFFIEKLTEELAKKAWSLFQKSESA